MHALLLTLLLVFTLPSNEAKTCSSIDVRNSPDDLEVLRGCTVIAGSLQILLMENKNASYNIFNNYSFPELREITDYLLFYRVKKLTSIGKLFPNLAVIRGQNLFLSNALVIYEMEDLAEVGLYGLLKIFRGNIRIEKNFYMCYMDQINWKSIVDGQVIVSNNGNFCNHEDSCPENCVNGCWNNKKCQKIFDDTCTGDCLFGCKPNGECEVCKHYIEDKRCVSHCSSNRYLAKHLSRCISEEECRALAGKWWTFGKDCLNKCPPKYEERNGTCMRCESFCYKICPSSLITNMASIQQYNGCTNITGNVIIRLDTDIKGDIEHELEKNLGYIEQIDEYLKIIRSMPIKNLNFFKNLRIIKGQKLDQNRYSLIVHENQNLQQLWDVNNLNLDIQNGTFFFHNNPKLCPSEIERLARLSNLRTNYSYVDVSNHSNGDSFACSIVTIRAQVLNVTENSAVVEWRPPPVNDCQNAISRFLIYYKEVDDNDMFSEEEVCGIPTWMTAFAYNNGNETTCDTVLTYNITELRTFTNYTYFIRTDSRLGGRSEILYFMTLSGDPSVPMIVKAEPTANSDSIRLLWEKPNNINGILSHYILVGFIQDESQSFIDQRDYCKVKMIEAPSTTESIIETTTIEPEVPNETCACDTKKEQSMVTLIQKEDFDVICSTLDKVTYTEAKGGVHSHGCGSYKYQVIPSHKPHHLEEEVEGLIEKREETTVKPDAKKNEQMKNGVYHLFERRIEGNESSFVMDQLQHFSIYILLLSACNENRTEVAQCSAIAMISQRTGRKPNADDIDNVLVRILNMFDVEVEWLEPANPNSVVVSYDIVYENLNNSRKVSECITRRQHQQANYKYKLRNLSPGQYRVQVRATSLAGPGNWSPRKHFHIVRPSHMSPVVAIVIAIVLLLCVSIGTYVFWKLKVKRTIDHRQLIVNVNPDYAGYQEDEWEIDKENIEIYQELGQGTFGQVFSGYIKTKHIPCAIKTVNDKSTMHDRMEFLNEATIMKSFNEAHHVVRLIGVVSRGPQPYVVMELMARGDLKSFLRTTRDSSTSLTCSEMYRMAAEIADGMSYLSAKKFVHRDLAARNCMVSGDRTVKIGDFGMTRDIYETDYYRKETRGLLPVRWMAPESLADGVFTSDSDVWSYGIVLWEIATLAEQPYQGLANEQVLQYVVAKGVLERPPQCPDLLYEIMAACWKWYPFQRPLFIDVVENLENHIGQDFRLVSFYHSRDGEEYRRNKAEINRERAMHMGAIPEGRVFWNRNEDSVHFEADSPSASPASVSLLSCQQHSLPNDYSPNPGTSYKPRLGG